jgi:hypothetical protein
MSSAFAPRPPSLALEAHDVRGALQLVPAVVGELAAQFGVECLVHDMSFRVGLGTERVECPRGRRQAFTEISRPESVRA